MATEQEQLMFLLAAIIEEAGGQIFIPASVIEELDDTKKIVVEFHNDTEEIRIAYEQVEEDNAV